LHTKNYRSPEYNVILIVIDALRADHVGTYGYHRDTTPYIDKLAKDGVLFEWAISMDGNTKSSIASLMTSKYPPQHGVNSVDAKLKEDFTTLAEVLNKTHKTAAFVHNINLEDNFGFSQGFKIYHVKDSFYGDEDVDLTKEVTNFIEKNKNSTFFCWIHFLGPHDPYSTFGKFDGFFAPKKCNRLRGLSAKKYNEMNLTKKEMECLKDFYDQEIRFTDENVGTILKKLKEVNIYDSSLIIITADHGEEFDEHGFISHRSYNLYDNIVHVPLIIKFPHSLYRGKIVDAQVRSIDIMPTILDFLGIKVNISMEGTSLLPLIEGKIKRVAQFVFIGNGGTIRTKNWKFIPRTGKDELYDLKEDPQEQNNVVDKYPKVSKFFNTLSTEWYRNIHKTKVSKVELNEKIREKLMEIGYIQ
jgi:arylsulfatase A-like enzyme